MRSHVGGGSSATPPRPWNPSWMGIGRPARACTGSTGPTHHGLDMLGTVARQQGARNHMRAGRAARQMGAHVPKAASASHDDQASSTNQEPRQESENLPKYRWQNRHRTGNPWQDVPVDGRSPSSGAGANGQTVGRAVANRQSAPTKRSASEGGGGRSAKKKRTNISERSELQQARAASLMSDIELVSCLCVHRQGQRAPETGNATNATGAISLLATLGPINLAQLPVLLPVLLREAHTPISKAALVGLYLWWGSTKASEASRRAERAPRCHTCS